MSENPLAAIFADAASAIKKAFPGMLASPEPRSASDFLLAANDIMEERGKQYDQEGGERSMGKTIAAFNSITGRAGSDRELSEAEGWLMMQILKNVRLFQKPGFHEDSAVDGVAYQALLAEAKGKESA